MFAKEMSRDTIKKIMKNTKPDTYSECLVLQSAAGYYVGTIFNEQDIDMFVPGSRDSEYFNTYKEAKNYLEFLTN